jgi:hypothetical protein
MKSNRFLIKKAYILASLFLIGACYILARYLGGDLNSAKSLELTGVVPYDSYYYAQIAEEGVALDLTFYSILGGALNWGLTSIIYGFFISLGPIGGAIFSLINLILACLSVKLFINEFKLSNKQSIIFGIAFLILNPYLIGGIISPNKEVIVLFSIIALYYYINQRQYAYFILVGFISGAFKVQILIATIVFLIFKHAPRNFGIVALVYSLSAPFIYKIYPSLSIETFIANAPEEIRSAQIMSYIEQISNIPLGLTLAAPVRLLLNLFAGLKAGWIFGDLPIGMLLPGITSAILSILSVAVIFTHRGRRNIHFLTNEESDGLFFLWCFLWTSSLIPFLQPRYYWWLIPFFIVFLIIKPGQIFKKPNITSVEKY